MKRKIPVILVGLLIACILRAQTGETLTNNAIIKMVQAKLTAELIIDVIESSPANFITDAAAIKNLENEKVPAAVIDAMKNAGRQKKEVPAPVPAMVKKKDFVPSVKKIEALNYVVPVKELILFYQNEAKSFDGALTGWDNAIRKRQEEAAEMNAKILQLEAELRTKKNADSKRYSAEIKEMNKKLGEYRSDDKEFKEKFIAEGEKIIKQLTDMGSERERSIGKKFDEVCQQIKSSGTDPGAGEQPVTLTITSFEINENTTVFLAPATEMMVWHQNEINELMKIIEKWNPRVREIVRKDAELNTKLQPIKAKLEEYKSDTKKYKTEIAALKKQKDELEKSRKGLADQMENDSRELSDQLKKLCSEIQSCVKERYTDIIGNMNYLYQEKSNL